MRNVSACLFVSLLLLVSTATVPAQSSAQASEPQGDQSKIHAALASRLSSQPATDSRNQVMVSLEVAVPAGMNRATAIAAAQGRVLAAFAGENRGRGLDVLARYQTLFGFSAEMTRGQIEALSRRSDVSALELMPIHFKNFNESFPLTDVDLAQNAGFDGTGSVIAIIDDGIDANHPAFAGKLLGGFDFADFDNDPTIDCLGQSHGTAVAGVALGNGGGSIGVAPGANLVFLKIQSANYCGQNALDGDVVAAIDWVVANKDIYGIDVISMSFGSGAYSSTGSCDGSSSLYFSAVNNAVSAGLSLIAASGNEGLCESMSRPACFSDVISVGAVYDSSLLGNLGWCVDRKSCSDSRRNPGCPKHSRAFFEDAVADNVIVYSNSADFLDVVAPATCAMSAVPGNSTTDCFGGTSSATPFTSGVAALAVQSAGKGALAPQSMRSLLGDTGDSVTDPKNGRVSPRVNGDSVVAIAPTYAGGPPTPNSPPTAAFNSACTGLSCDFDGSDSSDSDGTVISFVWDFGDGTPGSGAVATHAYAADGIYTVTLTVTDDDSAQDDDTQPVTVSSGGGNPGALTLSVSGYKVKGRQHADLAWTGATSSDVDIYRDGGLIATTENDGAFTDVIGNRGGGSYSYQVCESQTSDCSSLEVVAF